MTQRPLIEGFVAGVQQELLRFFHNEVLSVATQAELRSEYWSDEELSAITSKLTELPGVLAVFGSWKTSTDFFEHLRSVARHDFEYGTKGKKAKAGAAEQQQQADGLTFEDNEAKPLGDPREEAADPAKRSERAEERAFWHSERQAFVITLPALATQLAQKPKTRAICLRVLVVLFEIQLDERPKTSQKQLAADFGTNAPYVRDWARALEQHQATWRAGRKWP
jgi:hypothetical protein